MTRMEEDEQVPYFDCMDYFKNEPVMPLQEGLRDLEVAPLWHKGKRFYKPKRDKYHKIWYPNIADMYESDLWRIAMHGMLNGWTAFWRYVGANGPRPWKSLCPDCGTPVKGSPSRRSSGYCKHCMMRRNAAKGRETQRKARELRDASR